MYNTIHKNHSRQKIRTMSKYRIRFFSSFCDSENCKNVYERLCQVDLMDNYGIDKEIYITSGNDYTHAILMNTPMPYDMNIPKQNVVGIAFEPPAFLMRDGDFARFIEYAKNHVSKYCIGSLALCAFEMPPKGVLMNGTTEYNPVLPLPFVQEYSFMWHITPPRILAQKKSIMSIMVSQKSQAPGHIYRHALVKEILKTNLAIDIYGRGSVYYSYMNDTRVKGEFVNDEPYESYHFHICIENFQTRSYVSEKYTNTILWGTTPIYWGATHIDSIFPNITIPLSGNVERDMRMLADIIQYPLQYKKEFLQDEIRPKLNILKNLDTLFS